VADVGPATSNDDVHLAVAPGLLLVRTERIGSARTGSLVALAAATGKRVWTADATGISGGTPPVVASGQLAYASEKGVIAFSVRDGSVVYRRAMDSAGSADGVVRCGGFVCGGGFEVVVALNRRGKHVSDAKLPASDDTAELSQDAGGVVYLVSSSTVYRFS
jgi:outer membrane protein assembly factor BamB